MSRSNPTDTSPNPSTRWFEWDGTTGQIRYYDKEKKEKVTVGEKFQFILLDQLSVVKGWHDSSDSGITSNEVRDTKAETMVVRAFDGGTLAEGLYATIRDRIKAQGGHYTASLYIGFKNGYDLAIGNLQLKGAALNGWVDFAKAHRSELYTKAIKINGFTEGVKGNIKFRVPKFSVAEIISETDNQAKGLDMKLQEFLAGYFGRTRVEQVATPAPVAPPEDSYVPPPPEMEAAEPSDNAGANVETEADDDVPF